eukprot:1328253-Prymnesium_polylepis.1
MSHVRRRATMCRAAQVGPLGAGVLAGKNHLVAAQVAAVRRVQPRAAARARTVRARCRTCSDEGSTCSARPAPRYA